MLSLPCFLLDRYAGEGAGDKRMSFGSFGYITAALHLYSQLLPSSPFYLSLDLTIYLSSFPSSYHNLWE